MKPRVQISVYDDFDPRHYAFVRQSRIPRHELVPPKVSADAFIFWLALVGFIVGLWVAA